MNQPLAYIHPQAKIARNVVIEPFCTIHQNVIPGAVISGAPQDLKYNGEETEVIIGNNTVIRECVTISRGTSDKLRTKIGNDCLLMAYTHVAHDCTIGDHCILANTVQVAGHVVIDDYAIIGGASAVHQFVRIGAHVMVSGGSLIRKDVPPYTKAAREPLSYSGINSIGLRRRGFKSDKIMEIQELYRYLYLRGLNNSKAIDLIELELKPSKERDEIVKFVRNSDRGVMKGYIN
jgi:UDP-N-acetylglucosamine acyltransferase